VRNAVSEYGVGPYAKWYRAQATCAGIAAMLLDAALARAVDPAPRRVIVLLVVFALARFAITMYPMDLLGIAERTRTGVIHVLLAAIAFVSIAWAATALRPGSTDCPRSAGRRARLRWARCSPSGTPPCARRSA
jgi:hypothetical protein